LRARFAFVERLNIAFSARTGSVAAFESEREINRGQIGFDTSDATPALKR
jgi:hypothetical protein